MARASSASLVAIATLAVIGCAQFRQPAPPVIDARPRIAAQQAEIVEDYEARRDDAELHAAKSAAEQGNLSGCATALESILSRNAVHREARLMLADVQLARDNAAAAEQLLKALVRDYPADAAAHLALALLYESTGRASAAQAHFARAAALAPDDPLVALSALADDEATATAAQLALTAAGVAIAISPTPEAAAARTVIAAAQTPAGQAAIQHALALLDRGEEDGALAALREACGLEPQNAALPLAAAVHLLRSERPDAAIVLLEPAAARWPQAPAILRGLGAAYLQAGDFPAAQVVLQQAISLDSADALAYFLAGQVLHLQGRPAESRAALSTAARLDARFAP